MVKLKQRTLLDILRATLSYTRRWAAKSRDAIFKAVHFLLKLLSALRRCASPLGPGSQQPPRPPITDCEDLTDTNTRIMKDMQERYSAEGVTLIACSNVPRHVAASPTSTSKPLTRSPAGSRTTLQLSSHSPSKPIHTVLPSGSIRYRRGIVMCAVVSLSLLLSMSLTY